jgi:hypothetical protein
MPALFAYTVGMKSMQYTIRGITPDIDKALRARARRSGKSLNETLIDSLRRDTGLSKKTTVYHDLDWLKGSKMFDESFDEAMRWHDSLPNKIFDE